MESVFVFPGSFCPPTYGHLAIAKKAAGLFPGNVINIVCSVDPEKDGRWFTPEECVEMWRTYDLPKNVKIGTLDDFAKEGRNKSKIVMIRGIRSDRDAEHEMKVMLLNRKDYGIENYIYLWSDCEHKEVSSTKAREATEALDVMKLGTLVSPMVVAKLLEKALKAKNLFVVVGKAGSGKSTFLKMLCEEDPTNVFIDTDQFTHQLRPLLEEAFPGMDLVDIAISRGEELKMVIGMPWLELVKKALRAVPENSNVFLEIPYGFQSDKMSFRFFGGKTVYVGCEDDEQNKLRVVGRGTPQIVKFVDKIPGKEKTLEIAKQHKLLVICIDTSGTLEELKNRIREFNKTLK